MSAHLHFLLDSRARLRLLRGDLPGGIEAMREARHRFEAVGGRPRPAVAAVGTSDARLLDLTPELQPKEGFVRPMVTGILHAEGTLFVQGFIAPSGVVALDDRTGAARWAAVTDMSGIDAFALSGGRLVIVGFFTTVPSVPDIS